MEPGSSFSLVFILVACIGVAVAAYALYTPGSPPSSKSGPGLSHTGVSSGSTKQPSTPSDKLADAVDLFRTPMIVRSDPDDYTNLWKTRDCDALASEWLYTRRMAAGYSFTGYHVLCLNPTTPSDDGDPSALPPSLSITAYSHGYNDSTSFTAPTSSMAEFRRAVASALGISKLFPASLPWALYDNKARRVLRMGDLEPIGLLFEGGQWIWPGIEIGHTYTLPPLIPGGPHVILETLEVQPLVFKVPRIIEDAEADYVIQRAMPEFFNSGVAHQTKDIGKSADTWRTSEQMWLPPDAAPLRIIYNRVGLLVRVPPVHFEAMQVLRYLEGQKYSAHLDSFDLSAYEGNDQMYRMTKGGAKQRLATAFMYMSTVRTGGWTVFPRAGGAPQPYDFEDCSKGLRAEPVKGKMSLFYNLLPNGAIDHYSLHGGCKPLVNPDGTPADTKFSANLWVSNMP